MTKRPEISAKNYQAAYDYFRIDRTVPAFYRAALRLSQMLYQPDVMVDDEVLEMMRRLHTEGRAALIAGNHPSQHDPFVVSGALHGLHHPALQYMTGIAKDSLFRGATRPLFEKTGCIPVFRTKNYDMSDKERLAINDGFFDLVADRLLQDHPVAIMPEGTRSDPAELEVLRLDSIKTGIAHIALRASDANSYILPFGVWYGLDNPRAAKLPPRHAQFVVGNPITEYDESVSGVRAQVHEAIQDALDRARMTKTDS